MKTRIGFAVVLLTATVVAVVMSISPIVHLLSGGTTREALVHPAIVVAIVIALVLHLVGHLVRSEKHTLLLKEIRPIGRAQVFRGQMIGLMADALLPLRLGEIMRAHYVGRSVRISRSAVFATIVFERGIDLLIVALLGTAAVAFGPGAGVPGGGIAVLLVLSVGAFALAIVLGLIVLTCYKQPHWFLVAVFKVTGIFNEALCNRLRQVVWSFCHALTYALPNRRVLAKYGAETAVMWTAYLGSTSLLAGALLTGAGRPSAVLAAGVAPFSGVTNWLGLGSFDVFARGIAAALGPWSAELGLGELTVFSWGLVVVPSVVIGAYCLLHRDLVEHIDGMTVSPLLRKKLYRDIDTSAEFAHLLAAHFQGETLSRIVSREEALGRFTVIRPLKGGSNASTLLVWQDDEIVVKKITLPQYRSKLESQYVWLQTRKDHVNLVNATGHSEAADYYAIDIEFREGYVSFFEHLHAISREAAWSLLERELDFMDENVYAERPVDDPLQVLDQYVSGKIVDKVLDTAAASKAISQLAGYDHLVVNGERVLNFPAIVEQIRNCDAAMQDLTDFQEGPIHGDLTIDNMMVDPRLDEFMLIDPNDENLISDRVVDYAKLLQSLHSGYEFLVMRDVVEVEKDRISFEERRSAHYEYLYGRCLERFSTVLTPSRYRALLFHEAVHYCRMLTYRAKINPSSVPMYYSIAVRLFNRFLGQYSESVSGAVVRESDYASASTSTPS